MSAQRPLPLRLRANARFDTFHAPAQAPASARARSALERLIEGRERGPLYLWGEAGTGKTHLLLAACHAAAQRGLSPVYLGLRELVPCDPELLGGLEQRALVCVDDVDTAAGHEALELALYALYDRARGGDTPLVLTGSAPPAALGLARPELASRLAWGLCCRLDVLDDAGRLAVLDARAAALGLELPEPVGRYLLTRQARDLAALIGLLERLDHAALAAQRRLTLPFVRSVLETPAG